MNRKSEMSKGSNLVAKIIILRYFPSLS